MAPGRASSIATGFYTVAMRPPGPALMLSASSTLCKPSTRFLPNRPPDLHSSPEKNTDCGNVPGRAAPNHQSRSSFQLAKPQIQYDTSDAVAIRRELLRLLIKLPFCLDNREARTIPFPPILIFPPVTCKPANPINSALTRIILQVPISQFRLHRRIQLAMPVPLHFHNHTRAFVSPSLPARDCRVYVDVRFLSRGATSTAPDLHLAVHDDSARSQIVAEVPCDMVRQSEFVLRPEFSVCIVPKFIHGWQFIPKPHLQSPQ